MRPITTNLILPSLETIITIVDCMIMSWIRYISLNTNIEFIFILIVLSFGFQIRQSLLHLIP
jgi:hypothetical protein